MLVPPTLQHVVLLPRQLREVLEPHRPVLSQRRPHCPAPALQGSPAERARAQPPPKESFAPKMADAAAAGAPPGGADAWPAG
jgi:hypothetical protein